MAEPRLRFNVTRPPSHYVYMYLYISPTLTISQVALNACEGLGVQKGQRMPQLRLATVT